MQRFSWSAVWYETVCSTRDTRDVDITLSKESLKAAGIFADRTGGTFVLLRKEGEMARVVLQGRTFDFAGFRGPDLEADLRGRDFTVNAIGSSSGAGL